MNNVGQTDKEALENFIFDNDELEELEALTSAFNIFESLDIIKKELKHSVFLAWIMNPKESHGIGDYFVKRFLLEITSLATSRGLDDITPIEIDACEFDGVKVEREWKTIDIVVIDEENRIVCAIENKIEAAESPGQLASHEDNIKRSFNDYKKLYVFLTPDARRASHDNFINIGYSHVCKIIEHILRVKRNQIGDEVQVFLGHYKEMLRRHLMVDSNIQELCQRIYSKHKKALDLIFENKPDVQKDIQDFLTELINYEDDFVMDESSKANIRFGVKQWDTDWLKVGAGWTATGRLLLFEFYNPGDHLKLNLIIGPGDKNTRSNIYDVAKKNISVFNKANRQLTPQWFTIYQEKFLAKSDFEHIDIDTIESKIKKKWMEFKASDFHKITELIDTIR